MKYEMKGGAVGVEVASDGRVIDRRDILNRGLLVVGRKLLSEIAESEKAGAKPRDFSALERRAIETAKAAEHRSEEPAPEAPAEPQPAEPQPDPMIEIHRARQRAEELMD